MTTDNTEMGEGTTPTSTVPDGDELARAFVAADEERQRAGERLGAFFGMEPVEQLVDLRGLVWGTAGGRVYALGEARLLLVLDTDPDRNPTLGAYVGRGEFAGYWCSVAATATLYLFTTQKRDDGEIGHALRRWRGGAR